MRETTGRGKDRKVRRLFGVIRVQSGGTTGGCGIFWSKGEGEVLFGGVFCIGGVRVRGWCGDGVSPERREMRKEEDDGGYGVFRSKSSTGGGKRRGARGRGKGKGQLWVFSGGQWWRRGREREMNGWRFWRGKMREWMKSLGFGVGEGAQNKVLVGRTVQRFRNNIGETTTSTGSNGTMTRCQGQHEAWDRWGGRIPFYWNRCSRRPLAAVGDVDQNFAI
ncbi:hypothetical protein HAX54_043674 [Datura stramonium]|uniref:Uncharacterized protein n=1 Tax=Datura stramonium TaxID=4076 RepID=A0ABS8W324_DATST|nr:hypothetical protein [Datura stramonium]